MRPWCILGVLTLMACEQAPAPAPPAPDTARASAAQNSSPPEGSSAGAVAKPEVMDECPGEDKDSCGHAEQAAEDQSHFGKPFALDKREALSAATTRIAETTATVQVSGVVDAVCAKKGCWMVLRDGDVTARVFTHAGDFYLPIGTSKGRKAVVEGELKAKTISEKFAKHLAEDKGEDPSAVKGDQREWVMDATTISLL